jgi:hypothetical protein
MLKIQILPWDRHIIFVFDIYFISAKGFSRKKYLGGGVGTPSLIWGTTTRILIIFGVPPHKYKYLK